MHEIVLLGLSFFFLGLIANGLFFRIFSKKRVLLVSQHLGIGGLERMVFNHSVALKNKGHFEPVVFAYNASSDRPNLMNAYQEEGIAVFIYDKASAFSPRVVIKILQLLYGQQIGVMHSHDLGPLIYCGLVKIITWGQIKWVHTLHQNCEQYERVRDARHERFFTRLVNQLTVVSPRLKISYEKIGVPSQSIAVVPNGISFADEIKDGALSRQDNRMVLFKSLTSMQQTQIEPSLKKIWLLAMARIYPQKGQDHLIRIWRHLPANLQAATALFVVGNEEQVGLVENLKCLAEDAADQGVYFMGQSFLPEYWRKASHLFLSGSEFEGMPLGPLEAAGEGLELFVSDISGHAMVKDFATLFDLTDIKSAAVSLGRLIENYIQADRPVLLTAAIQASIREQYSSERMMQSYQKFYE